MSAPGVNGDTPLCVAIGEYNIGWHDPDLSLDRAATIIAESAANGARLVILPEMCTSGFTMDSEKFAEPPASEHVTRLSEMARFSSVWLIAGVPTRDTDAADSAARNSALVFSPSGALVSVYHKQRLFTYANEQLSYRPGDQSVVIDIEGIRVSPFICYDLRFPELFRRVASRTDLIVVIASWPSQRRSHWDVLLRARAIENQCYVIGVNRTGDGGSIAYDGGSAAYDPSGEVLKQRLGPRAEGVATVVVAAGEVDRVRAAYPFLADAGCPSDLSAMRPEPIGTP